MRAACRPGRRERRSVRRIPIYFPPLPGESFDSWLLSYAARLHTELEDLTEALGIGSVFMGQPAAVVAVGRRVPDLGRLVEATGLPADAVEALWRPLSRYSLVVGRRFGQSRMARAARPMRWTRFCPPCLAESGGRWSAAWRLPWFVACPVHLRLLASACPACGKHQRQSTLRYDLEPEPVNCSALPRWCQRPRRAPLRRPAHQWPAKIRSARAGSGRPEPTDCGSGPRDNRRVTRFERGGPR